MSDRTFVIVTEDFSGLGWATRLLAEGEKVVLVAQPPKAETDPAALAEFATVGAGLVARVPLSVALHKFSGDHTVWLFDTNHLSAVSEQLRAKGQKVLGASTVSWQMENDRAFAVGVAQDAGFGIPATHEFTNTATAIAFLDAHDDQAFVFKPSGSDFSFLTFVPLHTEDHAANRELAGYLAHVPDVQTFVLQARQPGVEVCVEFWVDQGDPFLATATLEQKRRLNGNLGSFVGCAGDVSWILPLDAPGVTATIGKLRPWLKAQRYTGFADVNVMVADRDVWFLEAGFRFGYNATPAIVLGLSLDPFGDQVAAWLDHATATRDWYATYKRGFAASVSLSLDHPRAGLPLAVSASAVPWWFPYDGTQDGDTTLLTGYTADLGFLVQHAYTLPEAAQACVTQLRHHEAVSVPDLGYRTDLHRRDYPGSLLERYDALQAMGFAR